MNIWVYWENLGGVKTPDHIKLCLDTIDRYSGSCNLVVLNENSKEVKDILAGGFPDVALALKADFIRANILNQYGGICVDADVVVLRDLSTILDSLINDTTFVGFEDLPYHARLGIMASKPGGAITKKWVRMQRERLGAPAALHWTALGCDLLWKAAAMFPKEYVGVSMDLFYPIQWTDADVLFLTEIDPWMFRSDLYGVQLFGKMTYRRLVGMSKDSILKSDFLVSKFFRSSLT